MTFSSFSRWALLLLMTSFNAQAQITWPDPYLSGVRNLPDSKLVELIVSGSEPAHIQHIINLAPKDPALALERMRTFADLKIPTAMYVTGLWLQVKDPAAAFEWLKLAADAGHPVAQEAVGAQYKSGKAVARNDAASFDYYLKAATGGIGPAMLNVATGYCLGDGVSKNVKEGRRWVDTLNKGQPKAKALSYGDLECE